MFWRKVMNGFRALRPMRRKFVFVSLIFLVPVVYTTFQRIQEANAPSSYNGYWVGIVDITKRNDDNNPRIKEDQGQAVMFVHFWPDYFSFLDRIKSEIKIYDSSGGVHTVEMWNLSDDWALPAKWKSNTLLTSTQDETLRGSWNLSFSPFRLTFDGSSNNEFSDGTSYTVTGNLSRGDSAKLQDLIRKIRDNSH